jgi:hypothetical protein
MKFGSVFDCEGFEMKGNASPDAQVEYLLKCLQIQADKVASLEMRLKTAKLTAELAELAWGRRMRELEELIAWQRNQRHSSESHKFSPSSEPSKTLGMSRFNSKPFAALLISFFAFAVALLVWRLKHATGN